MKTPSYYMFVDESGDASLNHRGQHFILSTVIINREDFEIIQGYMRLLKRKYFGDDFKVIHTTDLFERPYTKYRKLCRPKDVTNQFIHRLHDILTTIPYNSCVYHVDKDSVRAKYGYKPAPRRKSKTLNIDLPYELAATEAILDFTKFLKHRKSMGEIVIESRLHRDGNFVTYFDNARKAKFPGGIPNPAFNDVKNSIPSLFISNKDSINNGLEIADIVAYVTYRKMIKDPQKRMKLSMSNIHQLNAAIKNSAYKGASTPTLVHQVLV
jgi:hypothetical protein